jgi:hypothetical protein
VQFRLLSPGDAGGAARDLARDVVLAAAGALVVEEDAGAREETVRLPVDAHEVERVDLRRRVGVDRVHRSRLRLRRLGGLAEDLARGREEEPRVRRDAPERLEEPQRAEAGRVGRVLREVEGDLDVALAREVVDDVGLHVPHDGHEAARVRQVRVVEHETARLARLEERRDRVQTRPLQETRLADETVHLVPGREVRFREIGAVLTRDARDEDARHGPEFVRK